VKLCDINCSGTVFLRHTVHYVLKVYPLTFDNNFGKCGPIFKILSPFDLQENSLCRYRKDFYLTCSMWLHYFVKVGNLKMLKIQKCYRIFTLKVTINMFN